MSARSFKHATLAAFAISTVFGQSTVLLDGRGFKGQSRQDPEFARFLASPVAKIYPQIDFEKSLMIHDCGINPEWCNDSAFSFESMFARAAHGAGLDADSQMLSWYNSARVTHIGFAQDVAPWIGTSSAKAPFQNLAIVNRMDLAEWDKNRWKGAEIRFVFGRLPHEIDPGKAPKFTLIVEFVLPDMDWKTFLALGREWQSLASNPGAEAIKAILNKHLVHCPKVRIRINRSDLGSGWNLSEWDFSPKKGHTAPVFALMPLDGQIAIETLNAAPNSPDFKKYVALWTAPLEAVSARSMSLQNLPLQHSDFLYSASPQGMPTPLGVCDANPTIRNILALQQCSYCHTSETNTDFTHVGNRLTTQTKSPLSKFLTGGSAQPALEQLFFGDTGLFPVQVKYQTYTAATGGSCTAPTTRTVQRNFNDLARRALFLSAVLSASKKPTKASIASIQSFATDFSH